LKKLGGGFSVEKNCAVDNAKMCWVQVHSLVQEALINESIPPGVRDWLMGKNRGTYLKTLYLSAYWFQIV